MLGLPQWSSASGMYATHNIVTFESLLRKTLYGFVERLESDSNKMTAALINDLLTGIAGYLACIYKTISWNCYMIFIYRLVFDVYL